MCVLSSLNIKFSGQVWLPKAEEAGHGWMIKHQSTPDFRMLTFVAVISANTSSLMQCEKQSLIHYFSTVPLALSEVVISSLYSEVFLSPDKRFRPHVTYEGLVCFYNILSAPKASHWYLHLINWRTPAATLLFLSTWKLASILCFEWQLSVASRNVFQ